MDDKIYLKIHLESIQLLQQSIKFLIHPRKQYMKYHMVNILDSTQIHPYHFPKILLDKGLCKKFHLKTILFCNFNMLLNLLQYKSNIVNGKFSKYFHLKSKFQYIHYIDNDINQCILCKQNDNLYIMDIQVQNYHHICHQDIVIHILLHLKSIHCYILYNVLGHYQNINHMRDRIRYMKL